MSDDASTDDEPTLDATRYDDGTVSYPGHPVGPEGGKPVGTVDLSDQTAIVVTWTTSMATPPGVREPNPLAIVEFDVEGGPVRAIGGLTTDAVEIGDDVRPVYVKQLRDPDEGIRTAESQDWSGWRFEPV